MALHDWRHRRVARIVLIIAAILLPGGLWLLLLLRRRPSPLEHAQGRNQ